MTSLQNLPPMNLKEAVVCITGGSSGIGLGLAEKFLQAGSTVIITGRRESALADAKKQFPALHTFQGDVADIDSRKKLVFWLLENFPKLNVLLNNAGIMRRITAASEQSDWAETSKEIAINLEAPIHLTYLLTPHFLKQPEACFMSVSSGLAHVPPTFAPVYGATKAGIHSWTWSSRHAYAKTNIRLVEICPPRVETNLGGPGGTAGGEPLDAYCTSTFDRFAKGELEIGYKNSEEWRLADRQHNEAVSAKVASMQKPPQF